MARTGSAPRTVAALAAVLLAPALAVGQDWETEMADALKSGDINLNFRYRYEFVDQDSSGPSDPITDEAHASTLRTRLAYTSGNFRGFIFDIGMDDIRPVVGRNFNDTRNGKTKYPTVADPKGTSLNIMSLTYDGLKDAEFELGRQRIKLGNDRFVGNVGWRQNEQTYDSITANYAATEKLDLFYGYVDSVERIFGPDSGSPPDSFSSDTHLFDARWALSDAIKLAGYAYLMDLEGDGDNTSSNQTFGLRAEGGLPINEQLAFNYAAEYAFQEDYADNPNDYDEGYYRLDAGLKAAKWGVQATWEVLEGSGAPGESFQTPLATLHAFQGWADKFLNPLPGGIEDLFFTATGKVAGINLTLAYHDFSANSGGDDYGSEINFSGVYDFADYYSLWIGGAIYDADDFATDTTKIWVMFTADF